MSHTPNALPSIQPRVVLAHAQTIVSNVLLGGLFALFAYAAYHTWRETGHVQMLLLAMQEAIMVALVVTRRRTTVITRSPADWALALLGTAAPLLQQPGLPLHLALVPLGIAIQIAGAALSLAATISLGRSFGVVAANRGVRTDGLYRFVRHPLYGSYLVGYIGFLLGNASLLNLMLIAIATLCQRLRADAEERVLTQDPAYRSYAERVRYRFIPGIF